MIPRWFRRRRPAVQAPCPQPAVAEALIIARAGLTPAKWKALTNQERANIRWRVGA
jgi:hypothetical protein